MHWSTAITMHQLAAIRLFGMPGSRDIGIARRFEAYLDALDGGSPVSPTMDRGDDCEPICQAIRELQKLEPALRRPWKAGAKVPNSASLVDSFESNRLS